MTPRDETPADRSPTAPDEAAAWEGHRGRLRRRMDRDGWDALKPHEMLELVLYHAAPRQDLTDLCRALSERFGSVGGVLSASRDALAAVPGMTDAPAEWLALTGALVRAYLALRGEGAVCLSRWPEVRAYLAPMADGVSPGTWALYIDFEFNLITVSPLPAEPWWTPENARHLVRQCTSAGARYAILVRAFDAAPQADAFELDRLRAIAVTLRAIDVDILDCVLTGGGDLVSLNRTGRMDDIRAESQNLMLHERYNGD